MELERSNLQTLPIPRPKTALRPLPQPQQTAESVSSIPTLAETEGGIALRRLIGDIDIRNLSPRQMADTSLDLYVTGVLPWDEYAMLAFQPELHPDYDRTIGALIGEPAAPDRPRDFLAMWEERLTFDEKYNAETPERITRTQRIVSLFRQIDAPTNFVV